VKQVFLPGDKRTTSRLGYGTSGLHGGWNKRASLRLLETAFDAGIRHFDTAPMYGLGDSEAIVGEFLARHREQVSITTKFGLLPPKSKAFFGIVRALLGPVVAPFPRVKSRLVSTMSAVSIQSAYSASIRYSVQEMLASLANSLRVLRCDRIDLFLLHEGEGIDVNEDLRTALDNQVRKGFIGAWGLGSARSKIDRAVVDAATPYPVLQFEWSVRSDRRPHYPGSFTITHGALRDTMAWLRKELAEPRWQQALMRETVTDSKSLPKALLGAALVANPSGTVLFTSKVESHIRDLASLSETNEDAGQRLLTLLSSLRAGVCCPD
jgi:D-threo-aldose 1-dehydrogenase